MAARRSLARFWRRLRRPTFGRIVCVSLLLHALAMLGALAWLSREGRTPPRSQTPLIVELPPAAPGAPLLKPETAKPAGAPARPAPPARSAPARPAPPPSAAPPAVAKAPDVPPPPPAAKAPEPPPAPPALAKAEPAPPPPPAVPEPSPAPIPAPAPAAPPVPAPSPEAAPAPRPVEPSPPAVAAARPSEPSAPGPPAPPAASGPPPDTPGPSSAESIFGGGRFSLLAPKLDVPPLPLPGRGGPRSDGEGAGDSGRTPDGQVAVPLNTPDPRYAEYFAELKRRIEDKWVYPAEAARRGESGQGEVRFVLRKDGTVRVVEIVHSTGIGILDRYIANAIRMAAPFPPIPESVGESVIPISLNYTYVLGGSRLFGYR